MDQYLVASLALVGFALFIVFAYIWRVERKSRELGESDIHSGPDDVEKRSRRAF